MARSSVQGNRRREKLAKLLAARESVSTTELASRLKVSEMTIRRDLKNLQNNGVAIPCYGGAIATRRISIEFDFDERRRNHLAEKQRIGRAAAAEVCAGQVLFLDTGTTTLELAKVLATKGIPISVITASLVVASELWGQENIKLQILGGEMRQRNPDLVGPLTEIALERMTADIAFLGSDGIDPKRGSFAGNAETARIAERMAGCAKQSIVVCDRSKLGRVSAVRYIRTNEIDILITDKGANSQIANQLSGRGVEVQRV